MVSSVPFQALNLASLALYPKQEKPSDNGEVVSTVTAYDNNPPPPPPPLLHFTCTTNTSASSQGIIKPCAAIVLTYLGWLGFTRKLSFTGPFLWVVAPVCIKPMCGEVTNPQKGMGGGGLGGCTAVNLNVTDGKAVADHYHKSDKR